MNVPYNEHSPFSFKDSEVRSETHDKAQNVCATREGGGVQGGEGGW